MSMPLLIIFAVFGLMIFYAVRLSKHALEQADKQDALSRSGAISHIVVEMDPETQRVDLVRDDLETMRLNWHPIRFPESWESRSGGFPPEKVEFDGALGGRRTWCQTHCRARWRVEAPNTPAPIFWFEDREDADRFSLAWFPFKCL